MVGVFLNEESFLRFVEPSRMTSKRGGLAAESICPWRRNDHVKGQNLG
jgi:hypothetical protein